MVIEKAAYWVAVGVLALFVTNHFACEHGDQVRCLASRTLSAVEQISGQAPQFMAMAETMLGRNHARFARTQTMVACAQTRLASVQSELAQREASMARVQAERSQIEVMQQLRTTLICPRQNLRMRLPQQPSIMREGSI